MEGEGRSMYDVSLFPAFFPSQYLHSYAHTFLQILYNTQLLHIGSPRLHCEVEEKMMRGEKLKVRIQVCEEC